MSAPTIDPIDPSSDPQILVEFLITRRADELGLAIAGRGAGDGDSVGVPLGEFRAVENDYRDSIPPAAAAARRLIRLERFASDRGTATRGAEAAAVLSFGVAEGVSLWMTGAALIDGWDTAIPLGAAGLSGGISFVTQRAGQAYGRYKGLEARFQDEAEQQDSNASGAAAREVGEAYNTYLALGVGALVANSVALGGRAIGVGSGSPGMALLVSVLALGLAVVVVLMSSLKVRASFADEDREKVRRLRDLLTRLFTECIERIRTRRRTLLVNRIEVIDHVLAEWALVNTPQAAAARHTLQAARASAEARLDVLATRPLPTYNAPSLEDVSRAAVPEPPDPTVW